MIIEHLMESVFPLKYSVSKGKKKKDSWEVIAIYVYDASSS